MKKLLLSLLIPLSAHAELLYNKDRNMYFSTKLTDSMDPVRYHVLAQYYSLLIDNALEEKIDMKYMIWYIKEQLIYDASPEAMVLYEDLEELWS